MVKKGPDPVSRRTTRNLGGVMGGPDQSKQVRWLNGQVEALKFTMEKSLVCINLNTFSIQGLKNFLSGEFMGFESKLASVEELLKQDGEFLSPTVKMIEAVETEPLEEE
jgi:hypothetical protein